MASSLCLKSPRFLDFPLLSRSKTRSSASLAATTTDALSCSTLPTACGVLSDSTQASDGDMRRSHSFTQPSKPPLRKQSLCVDTTLSART